MDRHSMRPGYNHFGVNAPGHRELITQIFDRPCSPRHSLRSQRRMNGQIYSKNENEIRREPDDYPLEVVQYELEY